MVGTGVVTAATMRIERSGPAIREALARHAPEECPVFEAELGRALTAATQSFDLAPAQAVLDRWWGVAVTRANRLAVQAVREVIRPGRPVMAVLGAIPG